VNETLTNASGVDDPTESGGDGDAPAILTLEQLVSVWNAEGREFGGCAVSGSGLGFRGCGPNHPVNQVGGVLMVVLFVALVALLERASSRKRTRLRNVELAAAGALLNGGVA
jgi:hypothetical protein